MSEYTFDIESNMLLEDAIDYTTSPYSIREDFVIHSIVATHNTTREIHSFYEGDKIEFNGEDLTVEGEYGTYELTDYNPLEYTKYSLAEFPQWVEDNIELLVGHNIIGFDLMVLHICMNLVYENIGGAKLNGKPVILRDTMLFSKIIDCDIFGGHSLDNLASRAGKVQKYQFRKNIPVDTRFLEFAPDMLYYNILDTLSNLDVYNWLVYKSQDWDKLDEILDFENEYAYIIGQGTHRGFKFNKEKAEEYLKFLDQKLQEARDKVEPLLPPRPATKGFLKDHTPPANQIKQEKLKVPKQKIKGNGEITSHFSKFLDKLGTEWDQDIKGFIYKGKKYSLPLEEEEFIISEEPSSFMGNFLKKHEGIYLGDLKVQLFGKIYTLPLAREPLKTEMVATLDDTTHLKEWLVGTFGWNPKEYSEKDLLWTTGKNKRKRDKEEAVQAINKYIEESKASPFFQDRLIHLNLTANTFRMGLLRKVNSRSLRVLSNPKFTVGQNKDICPGLDSIIDKFPYAKDVIEFLTYRHRRNSILGGGADYDEDEEEYEKGYLAQTREDGRIPTKADTVGTPTNRMKHKGVANIPASRSLFGKEMRSLFGVGRGFVQGGYDFDQLEGKAEANEVWVFDEDEFKTYCNSLLKEKPNDVHTLTAKFISEVAGICFERQSAKAVKYGITYGAQVVKLAKTIGCSLEIAQKIFDAFWESAKPLKLFKDYIISEWKSNNKQYIVGLDGRRISTRKEHAVVNSDFQSFGAIAAKKVIVYHQRMMKEEGFLVDFFRDDWENSSFCQQMIAYHEQTRGFIQ